jgi:alkylation response protein AidB-like acyl-CoA dehydrogenase
VRFGPTPDDADVRRAVRDFLTKEVTPELVRSSTTDADPSPALGIWAKLTAMGVPGAAVEESLGGLGLGAFAVVGLLEEMGRVALPLPAVETVFVAGPLIAALPDNAELLRRLLTGELLVACDLAPPEPVSVRARAASTDRDNVAATEAVVPYASVANVLLRGDATTVRAFDLTRSSVARITGIDATRGLGRVASGGMAEQALRATPEAIAAAWDRGALGTAAQLLGLGRCLLDLTVTYVKDRRQFGRPVGSFQAVQHQLADALLALETATPAVARAAWSIDVGSPTRVRDVSMAKALAGDAAWRAAATSLQCHGAIGYTVEYDLHLYMKRVWALAPSWGSSQWHRERVGVALGLL